MNWPDRIFSASLLATVIGSFMLITGIGAYLDPRVPPCLHSHIERDAGFPLFAVPPSQRLVCDQWTIKDHS